MRNPSFRQFLAAATALLMLAGLAGCGGGSLSLAGGGTGGTGLGVVTGFGSVLIDDNTFDVAPDTGYFIDGEDVGKTRFEAAFGGTEAVGGAVALFRVRDVQSDAFVDGKLERIEARTALKGPVTGTNPLQVLGQTVVVTGDTVLADLPSTAELQPGDEVEVYGFTRADNVILATRLQRKAPGDLQEWKLTGFVTASGSSSFTIGTQTVSLNGVLARDCGADVPPQGRFVEVKAFREPGPDPLVASDVECKAGGLIGELDDSVALRRVQGFVSAVNPNGFTIGGTGLEGQPVRLTSTTLFRDGLPEDLVVGAKVEVTGRVTDGVLTATRVAFSETRVRIEAPVQDVDPTERTLSVLGIEVRATELARIDSGIFDGAATNVEVRGFRDRNNVVFATEIRRTDADEDLRLRGPAESINAPRFSILGIEIVPGNETEYENRAGATVSEADFFRDLDEGTPVQVKGGTFNPLGSSAGGPSIINPEEIELED